MVRVDENADTTEKQEEVQQKEQAQEETPVLEEVIEEFQIDAIIPGTEAEVNLLSNCNNYFSNTSIICNQKKIMPLMMDKSLLENKLKDLGLNYIETKPITKWTALLYKYNFPFIICSLADLHLCNLPLS